MVQELFSMTAPENNTKNGLSSDFIPNQNIRYFNSGNYNYLVFSANLYHKF